MIFSNKELGLEVRTITNVDGSISINAEDTARGFGWITVAKSGNEIVRWARVNEYCKEFGFSTQVSTDDYIPESLFYLLGMKANNTTAKKFQMWLATDVIPSIRQNGGYISENATQEQVKELIECHSFKSITKSIKTCEIGELQSIINEILEVNTTSKSKYRDDYHKKLNKTDYKIKLLTHIKKAVDERPLTANENFAIDLATKYTILNSLNKQIIETTRRSKSKIIADRERWIVQLYENCCI